MFKLTPFRFTYQDLTNQKLIREISSNESFQFEEKGLYLISGPSGSGKSTFLNILKGIIPYFIPGKLQGEIKYNEKLIDENFINEQSSEIVYLFQNPFSQLIQSSPELELVFTLENLKRNVSEYKHKKSQILKTFDLQNILDKKTSQLSNGECQKLVLASLVLITPKVILLDEPTAFLDPEMRADIYQILNQLKSDHLIIVVDHHRDEIKDYIDKEIFINQNGELSFNANNLIKNNKSYQFEFQENKDQLEVIGKNLSYSFVDKKILDNQQLYAKNGDVIILKGKNGVGKSTTFKILSHIEKIKNGSVEYLKNGKTIKDVFREVGFSFQNPESNFIYSTLGEELKNLKPEILQSFFQLDDLLKSPFSFSEGQKRRISILINILLNKKILFYDEPTFGQDLENIKQIESIILAAKNAGFIQFIISHDEQFIKNVGTKVLVLNEGKLNEA